METRIVFTAIVLVVAVVANWIYIEVVWGSFRAYMNACLIKSLIGVGCLVVILLATLIISKNQEIMKKILYAIDGRFGRRVLKEQYRGYWRLMTYGTLTILFIRFVMFPILEWWSGVVDFLNYVIWG